MRINVQLIDAGTDEHLRAEIFDRELSAENLFSIQSEISESIALALKATLSPEEQNRISTRPTDNLAAYDAYLAGRQLITRRQADELNQARGHFQRAVELDPEFARAWSGLALSALLGEAFEHALKSTELDPLSSIDHWNWPTCTRNWGDLMKRSNT